MEALKDQDWHVRQAAAVALGRIGDARAVEPLTAALKDKNSAVVMRSAAAAALGRIGDARAVEPPTAAVNDKAWHVQEAARSALRRIGESAVEPLSAPPKDKDADARRRAADALGKMGAPEQQDGMIEDLERALEHIEAGKLEMAQSTVREAYWRLQEEKVSGKRGGWLVGVGWVEEAYNTLEYILHPEKLPPRTSPHTPDHAALCLVSAILWLRMGM